MTETETQKFEQASNLIAQFFKDYMIVVKTDDKAVYWRSSDGCWAVGACEMVKHWEFKDNQERTV